MRSDLAFQKIRKFLDFRIKANFNLESMFENIFIVSKVPEEEQTSSQPITKEKNNLT